MSDDDYIDYCVMEAVAVRVRREEAEAAKKNKLSQWRKGLPGTGHG